MRNLLFVIILCLPFTLFSQDTVRHSQTPSPKNILLNDSNNTQFQQLQDSITSTMKALEQKRWEEQNLSGINYLMKLQEERKAKQRKEAIIRIGIGIIFLAVLIFGLRRRAKAKTTQR
jgi:hypothetical protein